MDRIDIVTIPKDQLLEAIELIIDRKLKQYTTKDDSVKYITKQDIARMFSISLSTVNNRIKDSTIKPYYIGSSVLFNKREVEESLKVKHDGES